MDPPVYQQLRVLLTRTVVEFCRKHNYFEEELKIQGTVCVTSDSSSFLVTQISEKFNASHGDSMSSSMRSLVPMFAHMAPVMTPNISFFPHEFPFSAAPEESSPQGSVNEEDRRSNQTNSPPDIASITSANLTPIWKGRNGKSKIYRKTKLTGLSGDAVSRTSSSPAVSDHSEYAGSERSSTPMSMNPEPLNCESQVRRKREAVTMHSTNRLKKPKTGVNQDSNGSTNENSHVAIKVENNIARSSPAISDFKAVQRARQPSSQSPSLLALQNQPAVYTNSIPGHHGQRGTSGVHAMYMEKCGDSCWRCILCNAEYNSRGTLHRHIDSRHLGRSYPCVICNIVFESHSGLSRHLRYKHTQHMPLACTVCPEKFINESALDQHMSRKHAECFVSPQEDQSH